MKKDFIKKLASMTKEDITDYIKKNGKEPKKIKLCIFLK